MSEKRGDVRTEFKAKIRLEHPSVGEHRMVTRDMSHSGLFLCWKEPVEIDVGDMLSVQTLDIEDAPVIRAKVVRVEAGGFAVMYVFDE